MPKAAPAPVVITHKIRLSEQLSDLYEERAFKHGRKVEDELEFRLRDCASHTASQGIYLDDDCRNTLSQLAGLGIKTPDELLRWAKQMVTLKVAGVDVSLNTVLAKRLESRCFGSTWEELIKRVVTQALEEYVGLR